MDFFSTSSEVLFPFFGMGMVVFIMALIALVLVAVSKILEIYEKKRREPPKPVIETKEPPLESEKMEKNATDNMPEIVAAIALAVNLSTGESHQFNKVSAKEKNILNSWKIAGRLKIMSEKSALFTKPRQGRRLQ